MIVRIKYLWAYLLSACLLGLASCNYERKGTDAFAPLPDSTNLAINQQIDFLTERIASDGSQADYYFQRGRLYYQIDRLRTALSDIGMALRLKGKTSQYLYWKALVLKDLKEYEPAMEAAQEALSVGQPDAPLYALIGQLFYLSKNSNEALYYLEMASQLLPAQADAIFYRGVIMYERQDTAAAIREFHKALLFDPKYQEVYERLASFSLQYGQPQRAGNYVAQAIKNGAANEQLYFYMAQSLQLQPLKADSAMHWYAEAVKMRPTFWEASLELAKYYFAKRNFVMAESYYQKTLEGNPNIKGVYFQLGFLYEYYLGRLPDALDAYQKGLSQEPDNTLLQYAVTRADRKIKFPASMVTVKEDTVPRPRVREPMPVKPLEIKRLPGGQ